MKLTEMKCPSCCAHLNIRAGTRIVHCEYCGSRFAIEDAEILGTFEAPDEDDQDPSLPIEEYAQQRCEQFLVDRADVKKLFKSSSKILRGLSIPDGETVYLIHDDTMIKSGKDGFAITERGLYCRPMLEDVVFYDWDAFKGMKKPELVDSYIECRGRRIAYFTGSDSPKDDLLDLYQDLYRHVKNLG